MIKFKLLILICFFSTNAINAQVYKKANELDKTESCLYKIALDTFKNKYPDLEEKDLKEDVYFLKKDDKMMIQLDLVKSNETYPRVQLHTKQLNINTKECKRADWQLLGADFFERGKYRMNPAMNYVGYFDKHDYFGSTKAAEVKKNGKWGFINDIGKIVVPFEYDSMIIHHFGILSKKGNQWMIVSPYNGSVSDLFDYIATTAPSVRMENYEEIPYTLVAKDRKAGLMNSNLEVKVPMIYDMVGVYRNTYIQGRRNGKDVLIDPRTGKEITPLKYDSISFDGENFETEIIENGKVIKGKIDMFGNEVK